MSSFVHRAITRTRAFVEFILRHIQSEQPRWQPEAPKRQNKARVTRAGQ